MPPIIVDDGDEITPVECWQDRDIEIMLDSGCCNHVLDTDGAPGSLVSASPGSRRGQNFIVGNGERVPNDGQACLHMEDSGNAGQVTPVQSTFQVAEVSRPLMSVSKICYKGYAFLFNKDGAQILDQDRRTVCQFAAPMGFMWPT